MAVTKFDVGGYNLAAEISGEGSPAVVFISGSGGSGDSWDAVISAMRSSTTVLTYARAGIGDSELPADSAARTLGAAADELRHLLAATGHPGPFVLVGHSFGGLIALISAARWPENLAGLVLVDISDIHLNLDIDEPVPIVADGNRADHMSYDVVASVDEVAPADAPSKYRVLSSPATSATGSTSQTSSPGAPSASPNSMSDGSATSNRWQPT